MFAGRLENLTPPHNPLDVLAQQTVAAAAMDALQVDEWYSRVRRAAPWKDLPRRVFDATLDMLSGRYPSGDFSAFRPKLVWNRETGILTARHGAQLLAVTSGGTIPDRGMYSVLLPEGEEQAGSRRVGELDEEMVYESRVNDIITLGATSWRIQQITRDQVIVTPAPGRSARLPFWRGEGNGRPAELGEMIGDFLHLLADGAFFSGTIPPWLAEENTIANIQGLIDEQRNATGIVRVVVILSSNGAVMKLVTGVLFCTLPMEDGCMNHGRWRLPGEYMHYGALTRLWLPVMTALLRAFLTPMVNCPMPRFFCLNQKSCCKLSARR